MKFFYLILFFFLSFKTIAADQDTIILYENFQLIKNNAEKYFFSKEELPFQQIKTSHFKSRDSLNLSYLTGWIWIKFTIKNETNYNQFVLSSTATHISGYYLYKPEGEQYVLTPAKLHHPEDGREVKSNLPSFYIELKNGETNTFYMKIRVEEEVFRSNFIIQNITCFVEYGQANYLILGIFFGVLIIILIVNVFYYFALKDTLFLIYAGYIVGVFAATLVFEGFVWMIVSDSIKAYHICFFCIRFWSDSLLFFTIRLVNLKEHNPAITKAAFIFIFYHEVIMAFLQLTDAFNMRLELMGRLEALNCTAALSFVFLIVVVSYKHNKYLFKYYATGLGAIALSGSAFPLYIFGYLGNYAIVEHSVKIGTLVEIIALSFAVSRRFRLTEIDLKQNKERELRLNETIQELETNVKKTQMNPHFMFNALTSIEYFISKNEAGKAKTYLNNFAQLMRLTLDNSRDNYIPLQDDLDALKFYIQLEFLRMEEHKHQFKITIEEGIDTENIVVPALLIQPFVENAIWHGLQNKESEGRLAIYMSFQNQNLQCIVEDDGGGIKVKKQPQRKSSGIQITKERLTLIHGMLNTQYKFEINDLVNEFGNKIGTSILFYMPYKTE